MILRMLPGPILGWLGTLMFLLLMQFLIRYLPEIAGKGLPFGIIVELVAYNLAYMVVLAVPMSILIGNMMVFGQLTEMRAYVVIKSAGISPLQLIWPTLLVGIALTGGMTYFNNIMLPESNFRASLLWQDIRQKKPGFDLQAGVFYEGLEDYSILVQQMPLGSGELVDVLIYDYTDGPTQQTVIKAARGRLTSEPGRPVMTLWLTDGEVHRFRPDPSSDLSERYERVTFDRFRLQLDLSDLTFERSNTEDGYRSDRTMRTAEMIEVVDSLGATVARARQQLRQIALGAGTDAALATADEPPLLPTATDSAAASRWVLAGLDSSQQREVYYAALEEARSTRARIEDTQRTIAWEEQRADRYRVEIHKKFSIALACLIFSLIGAPLGLSIRRGGLGTIGGLATGIFLFYWVTLVQGEKLADRGFLPPWLGMWVANLVMIALGLWLMLYVTLDLQGTPPLRRRLRAWFAARRPGAGGPP